jgi:ABC-type Fe3+-citrate transport system substrate-binding protein
MAMKIIISLLTLLLVTGCSSSDSVSEQEMESILNDAYEDHVSQLD